MPNDAVTTRWWADDRLEAVEAAGAEKTMHSISRLKEVESELVETKVSQVLKVATKSAADAAYLSAALGQRWHCAGRPLPAFKKSGTATHLLTQFILVLSSRTYSVLSGEIEACRNGSGNGRTRV